MVQDYDLARVRRVAEAHIHLAQRGIGGLRFHAPHGGTVLELDGAAVLDVRDARRGGPHPIGKVVGVTRGAIDIVQIDACRVGGLNEVLSILLMAAKYGLPVWPHAGGVGLCEYVQHLSMIDYIAVSGTKEARPWAALRR